MAKVIDDAFASMIVNLKEKTGKSLDDWLKIAASIGKAKHGEILAALKQDHGLSHGYANLVARRFLQAANDEPVSGEGLVSALFAGPKAALKPLYDSVIDAARKASATTWRSIPRSRTSACVGTSNLLWSYPRQPSGSIWASILGESSQQAGSKLPAVSTRCAPIACGWRSKSDFDADVKKWLEASLIELILMFRSSRTFPGGAPRSS